MGQKLVELFSQEKDNNLTVIDIKASEVNDFVSLNDVMGIEGSGANIDTLTEAGVANADIFIAVTDSDELNLLSCLMARKLGNCQTIARVRKPEYSKSINFLKKDLGLALIINPEYTSASEIARILRFPTAVEIDTFAKGRVEILKFRIPEDSVLDNMRVMEIVSTLGCDVLVCGVERDDEVFIPGGNFVLKSGDLISITTALENASGFFKKIGVKTNRVKDTTIVGGGDTAYYLAQKLLKTGIGVKIIEQDQDRCDELCRLLPKATIIRGDGAESRLLLEEGIEYAESFVSLTDSDEVNILLSLFAKSKMPSGKVITKINRVDYDGVIGGLDLDSIVYPKKLAAENIVKFVRGKKNSRDDSIETMHMILGDKAEAIEFRVDVDTSITGKTFDSIKLKSNTLIACINRDGKIIIPRGRDALMKGDSVVIVTAHAGFKDISDILD